MIEKDDDLLLPSPDPDHPCPKCKAIPDAPVDGYRRICFECYWTWWIDNPEEGYYLDEKIC